MKIKINLLFVSFILLSTFSSIAKSGEFTPVSFGTESYKLWRRTPVANQHITFCHFDSALNEAGDAIILQLGIEGSDYDYFGWDMPIPLNDFPLKSGYHHEYRVPGMAKMNLDYDGKTLNFSWVKKTPLFTVIFPFSIEIDPNLTMPKLFKGIVAGYEKDMFGHPIRKISEECTF